MRATRTAPPARPSAARSPASRGPGRSRPSSTTRGSRPTGAPGRPRAGCAAAAAASCAPSSPGSSRSPGASCSRRRGCPPPSCSSSATPSSGPRARSRSRRSPSASRARAAAGLGGARVTFEGDPIVFQWYPGQGLQIQPLANFGKANALWRACQPPTEPPQPGAEPPPRAGPRSCSALLDRLVALASQRGGFTAWEYFFAFGGGTPPWISGLAQGTAIQALTRGSQLLGDPKYVEFARGALGAFERKPPLGVRAPSTSGAGRHYLIYSFSSGLRVLNGFLQSLVGLYDFADATKDKRARAAVQDRRPRRPPRDPALRHRRVVAVRLRRLGVRPRLPPARARLPAVAVRPHADRAPTAGGRSGSTATCTSARGSASAASARSASAPTPTSASRSRSSPA